MKCPDCKGTGEYKGANIVEKCQLCKGLGTVEVPDHLPTDEELAELASTEVDPGFDAVPIHPVVGHKVFIAKGYDIEAEITKVDLQKEDFHFKCSVGNGYAKFHEIEWIACNNWWQID